MSLHRTTTLLPDEVERRLLGAPLPEMNKQLSPGAIEARQLIEKARLMYEASQAKEKAVPDLKTALQTAMEKNRSSLNKVIDQWDDEPKTGNAPVTATKPDATPATTERGYPPKQPHVEMRNGRKVFAVTTNTSRATFEHVRDNPGKTRMAITSELIAKGHKKSSVQSLLGQMLRQGQLRQNGGLWYSVGTEFRPIKAVDKRVPMPVETKPERKVVTIQRRKAPEPAPAPTPSPRPEWTPPAPQINAAWNAATILDHLSIKQARALYDELKTIFGA